MKISAIRVDLDEDQIDRIMPKIAEANAAGDAGEPGMLLAQVMGTHMFVFFIDGQAALAFQALMGQRVGLTTEDVRRSNGKVGTA